MGHLNYEDSKKLVFRGMWLLAAVTLIEVVISLFGKGHLGYDPGDSMVLVMVVGVLIAGLSIYKAYYIIYEFMHMGAEVKGLRMSVLLPVLLLVWAIIAFFHEGNSWKERRQLIKEKNEIEAPKKTSSILLDKQTKSIF